jgi:hypothetical protein
MLSPGSRQVAIRPYSPTASRRGRRYATALVQARSQMPTIGRFGHLVQTASLPEP